MTLFFKRVHGKGGLGAKDVYSDGELCCVWCWVCSSSKRGRCVKTFVQRYNVVRSDPESRAELFGKNSCMVEEHERKERLPWRQDERSCVLVLTLQGYRNQDQNLSATY